jgi:hypothetical protein
VNNQCTNTLYETFFLIFISTISFSQPYKPQRTYLKDANYNIDSLNTELNYNKKLPDAYKLQCLIALSYFPELHDTKIKFRYSHIHTSMRCRPRFTSIFSGNRVYKICINNKKNTHAVLLSDAPFNAQIGVIGHELAHVKDFKNKGSLKIFNTGIYYFGRNNKKKYEQEIDLLTIHQGLGWQLYDWADYSMNLSTKASPRYKQFKRNTYLSPTQIEAEIKKINSH